MITLLYTLQKLKLESITSKEIKFNFSRVDNNGIFTLDTFKTERNRSQFLMIPALLFEHHERKIATNISDWQMKDI